MSRYLYISQMNIPPEIEPEFNRIYDGELIPQIMAVPGIEGVERFVRESATMNGFPTAIVPHYLNLWSIADPGVVKTPEWRAAVYDRGQWMPKIWPHTFDRFHSVFRRLD